MRPEKKAIIGKFRSDLADFSFFILTNYHGMIVNQTTELRRQLLGLNAQFHIVKNSLFRLAAADFEWADAVSALNGPLALVIGKGDLIDALKLLNKFNSNNQVLVSRLAVSADGVLAQDELEVLVKLPSKNVLQAMFAGMLAAPLSQFVGVLSQKVASLLYVLRAIQEKKEKMREPSGKQADL